MIAKKIYFHLRLLNWGPKLTWNDKPPLPYDQLERDISQGAIWMFCFVTTPAVVTFLQSGEAAIVNIA